VQRGVPYHSRFGCGAATRFLVQCSGPVFCAGGQMFSSQRGTSMISPSAVGGAVSRAHVHGILRDHSETFWDHSETFWDHSETFWDHSETFWDHSETFWDHSETFWDHSESFWDLLGSVWGHSGGVCRGACVARMGDDVPPVRSMHEASPER